MFLKKVSLKLNATEVFDRNKNKKNRESFYRYLMKYYETPDPFL